MNEPPITVGLLGCGTVGTGVVQLLTEHADEIAARVGAPVRVGPVAVRDASRPREVTPEHLTTDPDDVVAADGVDVVIEVMGGVDEARALVTRALERGRSVVTANKELIASHGPELRSLATERGARLEYEAAVAGGIPIIKPLRESLAGDRIRRVLGILNGTTNYMLTRMSDEGSTFEEALAEAQALGYAEADPSADVDGYDAASKTAILASLAFDADVRAEDVHCDGIRAVTAGDIAHAERMGYVVKLLGIAEEVDGGISARVHPSLVPRTHPLASVREAFNAVFTEGDASGELMFYGRGAGSLPTASAVLGDLVTAARALRSGERPNGHTVSRKPIRPFAEVDVQSYVLLDVVDASGVLAEVASCFGANKVSIKSVWQEGHDDLAQLLLITHRAQEAALQATLADLRGLSVVRDVASVMRVEGGEL